MNQLALNLIARSIRQTEIVHATWTPCLAADLTVECEDNVEASASAHEFWGTDADGSAWRVHLDGRRDGKPPREPTRLHQYHPDADPSLVRKSDDCG